MQERQAWKIAAATLALGLLSWTLTLVFLPSRDFTPIEALVLVVTAILAEARSLYVPGYGAVNFGEGLYFAAALAWGAGGSSHRPAGRLDGRSDPGQGSRHPGVQLGLVVDDL